MFHLPFRTAKMYLLPTPFRDWLCHFAFTVISFKHGRVGVALSPIQQRNANPLPRTHETHTHTHELGVVSPGSGRRSRYCRTFLRFLAEWTRSAFQRPLPVPPPMHMWLPAVHQLFSWLGNQGQALWWKLCVKIDCSLPPPTPLCHHHISKTIKSWHYLLPKWMDGLWTTLEKVTFCTNFPQVS